MTSCGRFGPEIRRPFPLADIISLKTMAGAVLQLRQPRGFQVQFLTVEKTLSTGLAGRMRFQCSQGKSWKHKCSSRSPASFFGGPFAIDAISLREQAERGFGLLPGLRMQIPQGRPEAESAIADGRLGRGPGREP